LSTKTTPSLPLAAPAALRGDREEKRGKQTKKERETRVPYTRRFYNLPQGGGGNERKEEDDLGGGGEGRGMRRWGDADQPFMATGAVIFF